jgi:RNA polymerase sigma-70 factor (ECF subfamily)
MIEVTAVDENILVRQAMSGDRGAFSELVCVYHSRVINVIYRMSGDAVLAEDAAQISFLKAWQSLPKFTATNSQNAFRGWLYRIAVNTALDILRKEKPQVDIEQVTLVSPNRTPEAGLEHHEQIQRVRQAIMTLPEASRVVLILKEYEGLSYREIADTLDIPLGTVMSRLSYARNQLSVRLRSLMEAL